MIVTTVFTLEVKLSLVLLWQASLVMNWTSMIFDGFVCVCVCVCVFVYIVYVTICIYIICLHFVLIFHISKESYLIMYFYLLYKKL